MNTLTSEEAIQKLYNLSSAEPNNLDEAKSLTDGFMSLLDRIETEGVKVPKSLIEITRIKVASAIVNNSSIISITGE
jgi:hypothetical protein